MPNDLANKERVSLPRMLFLPTVLASFVMNKNCTPWEIYEEINCLLLEGVISDNDDLELIKKLCLAAGQTTSATKCSPALKMVVQAASERVDNFSRWAYNLLNNSLGPKEAQVGMTTGSSNLCRPWQGLCKKWLGSTWKQQSLNNWLLQLHKKLTPTCSRFTCWQH